MKPIHDHKGNQFPSINAMCKYWNVLPMTYLKRIARGCTIEEALTGLSQKCQDHEGNIFPSVRAMCKYWKVPTTTYYSRIKKGYPIEYALSYDEKKIQQMYKTCKTCQDHKGNIYPSYVLMCEAYGKDYSIYEKRIKKGYTLERALTQEIRKVKSDNSKTHKNKLNPAGGHPKRVQDHKGKEYVSITKMCKAYKVIPSTYKARLERGWNQKDALEGKK